MPVIGLFPGGTGNDLCRAFNIDSSKKAIDLIFRDIESDNIVERESINKNENRIDIQNIFSNQKFFKKINIG